MLTGQEMSPKQKTAGCFYSGRWLTFWLVLTIVQGKDSHLSAREGNRDVGVEVTKAQDGLTDNIKFPSECNSRKLTKRSSSFGILRFRGLENQGTDCQIFPVTTTPPLTTKPRITTQNPRKQTHHIRPVVPRCRPWFVPYYRCKPPHTFFNALLPCNRGAFGHNTICTDKFESDESSEEKRGKRHRLPIVQRRSKTSMED